MNKIDESKGEAEIKILWCLGWIVALGSLVGQVAALQYIDSAELRYSLGAGLPLVNWILPCIFPKLYFMDFPKVKKKQYNSRRLKISLGIMIGEEFVMMVYYPVINLVTVKRTFLFGGILFASLLLVASLCILPRCEKKQVILTLMMYLGTWSVPATAFLIVATGHETTYETGMVQEKRVSDDESSTDYYIKLQMEGGQEKEYKVTDGLYEQVEIGQPVNVTRRNSLFGIQYDAVRSVE